MNASQKEVELKLELTPASLPSIKQVPLLKALKPSPSRTAEISVYFDTDKYKLRKNGLMLRVRRIQQFRAVRARRMGKPDCGKRARPKPGKR